MRSSFVFLAAAALFGPAAAHAYSQADVDSGQALFDMSQTAYDNAMDRVARGASGAGCTPENVRVRREWYVFPTARDNERGGEAGDLLGHTSLQRTNRKSSTQA